MNGSDLVLIQTSLFYHVNRAVMMLKKPALEKQRGLYQNKVTSSLAYYRS